MGRPRIEHQVIDGVEHKRCCACKQWLALDQFGSNTSRRDGLSSTCRPCSRSATAKSRVANIDAHRQYDREYATTNRAKKTAARRAWRDANHDRDEATRQRYLTRNAEAIRQQIKARYWANRDARIAQNRQSYEADREGRIAQAKQWRQANPQKAAEISARAAARRRTRLRGLPSEPWTIEQLIARDGMICWMCLRAVGGPVTGRARDWHVDHLIPLAKDFPDHPGDTLTNLAVACETCNKRKSARLLPEAIARYLSNVEAAAA